MTQQGRVYHPQAHTTSGRREDLGCFMRSSTEANIARLFTHWGIPWQYEPREFKFPIERGERFYTPDFQLGVTKFRDLGNTLPTDWPPCFNDVSFLFDAWVEIKGWKDPTSQTKLRRFMQYYPGEALNLLIITRNPRVARYRWGKQLNAAIDRTGVKLIDSRPLLLMGPVLSIPHWERGGAK